MTSPGAERVVSRGAVLWRRCGDEILIRRRGDNELVALAGTGVDLWLALDAPRRQVDLASDLAELYDAKLDVVAADVAAAVETLVSQGVARVQGDAS